MKAMIFAAGLGTRLKPITDSIPKALVHINGKALLEHTIIKLIDAGFDELIINIHHFPKLILDFLEKKNNFGIRIEVSDESGSLLETGGAIKKASWFFDDNKPFLIHNVDILSNVNLPELYQFHVRTNPMSTLVVSNRSTFRYLLFDDNLRMHGWINEKTGDVRPNTIKNSQLYTKLAFSGIQVISPEIFKYMKDENEKFPIIEFYLKNIKSFDVNGYIPNHFKMIDVGKVEVLNDAESFLK